MWALFVSLCVAAVPGARFVAVVPVPPRPDRETDDRYEHFAPLGISADRTQLIAQAGTDLVHWDVAANKLARTWERALPPAPPYGTPNPSVAVSEDGKWLGVADGRTWKLSNIADRKHVASFVLPDEAIRLLVVAADGKTALTAGRHDVRVWDVPTGREQAGVTSKSDLCWAASNAAFDEHVLYDNNTNELVWLKNGGAARRVELKDTPIADRAGRDPFRWMRPVRPTPDGKHLVYPAEKEWVTLDRDTGAVVAKAGQSQEKADVTQLGKADAPALWTLDPAGKRIVAYSWGADSHLRVIDRASGQTVARHDPGAWAARQFLAASASGDEVYLSHSAHNQFEVIDTKTGKHARTLGTIGKLLEKGRKAGPDLSFKDGLFASESEFLVLNESWHLSLYDLPNPHRVVRSTTVPGDGSRHQWALSPTGNTLAVSRCGWAHLTEDANAVPKVHLWGVRDGNWQSVEVLPSPGVPHFTPDGGFVVVECQGLEQSQVFVVIDVLTGQKKHVLRAPDGSSGHFLPGPTGELGWERRYSRDLPDFRFELDCKKGEFRPVPVVWRKRWEAREPVSADRRSDLSVSDERHANTLTFGSRRHDDVVTAYLPFGAAKESLRFSPDSRHFASRDGSFLGDVFARRSDPKALPGKFIAFSPSGDRIAVHADGGVGVVEKASVVAKPKAAPLTAAQAKAHWRNLSNPEWAANRKMQMFEVAALALVASPDAALEVAKAALTPAAPLPEATLRTLFAQLNDPSADARLKAFDQLGTFDRRVLGKIAAFVATDAPHEAKRLARKAAETIPDDGPHQPQDVHAVYAVEVVERIGTADAAKLLGSLAAGDPAATLTREATAAHFRLKRLQELRERR